MSLLVELEHLYHEATDESASRHIKEAIAITIGYVKRRKEKENGKDKEVGSVRQG